MRWGVIAIAAAACGGGETVERGPHVKMDFARPTGLYDAPFPSDDLLVDGAVDVSAFPNPEGATIVEQARALVVGRAGWATSGGVFFQLTDAIDEAGLPTVAESVEPGSPVFLVSIDADAPDHGRRYPVEVELEEYPGLYAAPNLLSLLPLQGVPLRAGTRYAAVVTTALGLDAATGDELAALGDAVDALAALGVDPADIAGATAFTTGDPMAELLAVRDHALGRPVPQPMTPWQQTDLFDDYCVYQATIELPDYQDGEPPYDTEGGQWRWDAGEPVLQREAPSRLIATVPRAAMPAGGYPLVVFIRTGGGGDRPLIDRGRRAEPGGPSVEAGEGPARAFAGAGFAGLQFDGPLGGARNVTGGDEQFLIFNVRNLGALRDNVRQSAVETVVIAHVAAALSIDTSDCPGAAATTSFDAERFALMGHSMGATIAPLAAAAEPRYGALLLSGAGGSWIENIVYKRKPLEVAPIIGLLIKQGFDVRTDDPVLTLAQWALEPADPQVYGAAVGARDVLMMQGIVDNYILPRIANTTSLSLGLDLAGEPLDDDGDPRLDGQTPLAPLLPLVDRGVIALPAAGNAGGHTAVVVQIAEDGVEDGHEVVFQTDGAKHQYRCFLASWAAGAAAVPAPGAPGAIDAPCPAL